MSIRDTIREADDLNRAPVKAWGLDLFVRELTLGELAVLSGLEDEDLGKRSAMLIALSLCDEAGQRIWSTDDEALSEIQGKSFAVLKTITEAANAINGLSDEETPGNSESALT